jgi:hypothetical protein
MKEAAIGLFLGALIAFFLMMAQQAAAAPGENCPSDWHPPPCGEPQPPVKSWLMTQLKNLEGYHFSAAQVAGVAYTATCIGSTGRPDVDTVRRAVCAMSKGIGAFAGAMAVWENRLIEQLNAARDGTQFVFQFPLPPLAAFVFVETDSTWLNALQYDLEEHRKRVEEWGNDVIESVKVTYQCDAWALYDVDGIICGNNQREVTDTLLNYIGERGSAVSAIEDAFLIILAPDTDVVDEVAGDFIAFVDEDSEVNGWEGYNLQLQ